MPGQFIRPRDEILPVRRIGMAAIMLPPGKLAVEKPHVNRGHLFDEVVIGATEIFGAEQAVDRLRGNRRRVRAVPGAERGKASRARATTRISNAATSEDQFMRVTMASFGAIR
jgi:hypothetical protein